VKPTEVRVTAAHIAQGRPQDCNECPVALALREALGPGAVVAVDEGEITAWMPGAETWRADTPAAAKGFIRAFDNFTDAGLPPAFTLTWRGADDETDLVLRLSGGSDG
jgi:hypothetical protein